MARADWVVEGKMIEIINEEKEVCESFCGCGKVWSGIGVAIEGAKLIKGQYPIGPNKINFLVPGSRCWEYRVRISEEKIGSKFKFFGIKESYGYWARLEYFLRREIE